MKTTNLKQGSTGWHEHRSNHYNASDAPAMMGKSIYKSRDELMAEVKFGINKEINAAVQKLFDAGHKKEALARPIAEKIIGSDLFPITGFDTIEDMPMSASFDGLTMLEDINWEHKSINQTLRDTVTISDLDIQYKIQMEQQMMLSGAYKSLFMASDGTENDMVKFWYEPNFVLRNEIVAGWKQFEKDLLTFEMPEVIEKPVADIIQELPALTVGVEGRILTTNIDNFEASAQEFIAGINTTLVTDEDFANAEQTVKFCATAEEQIRMVKKQAVDQMADVSKIFRTMDMIADQLKQTRLSLDKSVKSEKNIRKAELIQNARNQLAEVLVGCEARLGGQFIWYEDNFVSAIKGKRSLEMMQMALNDEIARQKIMISAAEVNISENIKAISGISEDFGDLFPDRQIVVCKPHEDVLVIIDNRILKFNENKRQADVREQEAKTRLDNQLATAQHGGAASIDNHTGQAAKSLDGHTGGLDDYKQRPETEAIEQTDIEKLKTYISSVQVSAMLVPVIDDINLNRYVQTRYQRIMTACEEIKSKVLK